MCIGSLHLRWHSSLVSEVPRMSTPGQPVRVARPILVKVSRQRSSQHTCNLVEKEFETRMVKSILTWHICSVHARLLDLFTSGILYFSGPPSGIIFRENLEKILAINPSLRSRIYTPKKFRPPVGQRVNTHSVFWEFCWSRVNTPLVAVTTLDDVYTRRCFSESKGTRFGAPGQKALPSVNEFTLFVDFCLIPLSTTCSVEVPGTNL